MNWDELVDWLERNVWVWVTADPAEPGGMRVEFWL